MLSSCLNAPTIQPARLQDPINCDTYASFAFNVAMAVVAPNEVLDRHNLNEANYARCKLGDRTKSLGPR